MHITNDFFLLIWQEDAKSLYSSSGDINAFLNNALKSDYESFCDYSSIVLITSASNMEEFAKLQEAKNAVTFLAGIEEWDKKTVQYVQKELLFFLNKSGNLKLNKAIEKRLDRLRKEEVIGYEKTRKLISLLALIEAKREEIKPLHVIKAKQGNNYYENSINILNTAIENLKSIIEDEKLDTRLSLIPEKLKEQKFSIGVTGVMNAGKSTMLNALLKEEILGTSVIPETANLSIIKYAKTPSAKVNFWNKKEWEDIEKSSLTLESIKPFIEETKKHFNDDLSSYIRDEGRSEEIKIDELPSYTSAEHSGKKCNLVKSVELYSDIKFVENGVEIVDTPGLDDPVIQREEITKNYLLECDLMLHLMNVNQSATAKDIEFIIDTLLYQNIARLLVVITRIDTVSQDELQEVIEYTKSSIKTQLESLNKQNEFDNIIDKIDFMPIAGKMALLHRIGKKEDAISAGYDLEKTGILNLESYLSDILFGDNSQKANLIIEANKKELISIINMSQNSLHVEKNLLGKSASEIEHEYEKYQLEIVEIKEKIEKLNSSIKDEKETLTNYFSTLENISKNKMTSLKSIAKRRVVDDVSYELRKNKTKPKESRISYIIETAIKDGFIDLLRDYRYQFQKKIENSFEKIGRDFEDFLQESSTKKDAKEFFERHFSDLNLVNSNAILIKQVNTAIKSHPKKDIEGLDSKLEIYFSEALNDLYDKFSKKAIVINQELVDDFVSQCNAPLAKIEFDMSSKEETLNIAKKRVENKSFDANMRLEDIEQKLSFLEKVDKDLGGLR